ncbi:MAG: DUF2283 domain-containing protein [Candidatus Saccharibacteria bacterium]|nr:DUF2283 domain-containing protein [Microbacteriaceae bacterium]
MTKRTLGTYDHEADAAYFPIAPRIRKGQAGRQDVHEIEGVGGLVLDFDKKGRLLDVEVLGASTLLKPGTLARTKRIG